MNEKNATGARRELYHLLGRLPERNASVGCRVVDVVEYEHFILEKLVLNIQSADPDAPYCEPIPAYFTRPKGKDIYPAAGTLQGRLAGVFLHPAFKQRESLQQHAEET